MSQIVTTRTSERPVQSTATATANIRIERIVAGGYGLARHEGRVLLVPMTAPGDLVEVALPNKGPRSELVRVIEPGPDRIQPICQHFGECGGCDLMHLSYEAQSVAKLEIVSDAMRRIGGAIELPGLAMVPNPEPFGSRSRGNWRPTGGERAGYVRRGSHEVIPIEHCPILDPALEAERSALRISAPAQGLSNGAATSIRANGQPAPALVFAVAGERFLASAEVFFQATTALLDDFVARVVHEAARGGPDLVLELFSGIGLFTIPLARRVGHIVSVESDAKAVAFAHRNAAEAGVTNATIAEASVELWLARGRSNFQPDVVVVDPPRVGLSAKVAERLMALAPARLVYVSCDPATFARDARKLVEAGYRIAAWTAFDLFPQTHHVELVGRFERTDH